jgi:hypothetical protein
VFHIHKFSHWKDILIFGYAQGSALLQGRKCTKCSATYFRITKTMCSYSNMTEEKLNKCGLWNPSVN